MNGPVLNELKAFNIYCDHELSAEVKITNLLTEEGCRLFLQDHMRRVKAPNITVAASMFSKRYAALVVSSTLFTMVEFNGALHLPLDACALSNERKLLINEELCKLQEIRDQGREQWREEVLSNLFAYHLTPIITMLKKVSGISTAILWENVAIRVNSIYRKMLAKELDPIREGRIASDFHFLKTASGDLFHLNENPIKPYIKFGEELRLNPIRQTCCMYYRLEEDIEGIGYCKACPIKNKQKAIG